MQKKNHILISIAHVLALCSIIAAVSLAFVYKVKAIGFVLVILSGISLLSLRLFKIRASSVKPDVLFGVIDNGVLALMAVFGGKIAGVAGAIVGGVVGNAVTDGIAGLFEGYMAEKMADDHRTILGAAVGKMAGCLLGAGVVLVAAGLLSA